jgi:ribosomal protein S18 acetylase RimI-like enzyme
VMEALGRSLSCSLFVRSDNQEATGVYRALGFSKFEEALCVDMGTGVAP